jgi:hypothetical protein
MGGDWALLRGWDTSDGLDGLGTNNRQRRRFQVVTVDCYAKLLDHRSEEKCGEQWRFCNLPLLCRRRSPPVTSVGSP